MADDYEDQETQALKDAREAAKRNATKAKEAEAAREAAETELQTLRSQARSQALTGVLSQLGAPEGLAAVYPQDRETTAEAVQEFINEVGIKLVPRPDLDAWGRHEKRTGDTIPPGSGPSEEEQIIAENEAILRKWTKWYASEEDKQKNLETWDKVARVHANYEQEALSGKVPPLVIESSGFGGPHDAPKWARTAEVFRR